MMARLHQSEQGVALITVIGVISVLAILSTGLLSYGLSSMRQARHDQDWNAALAAAQAGIDDFLFRVNRDSAYWQSADPDWDGGAGTPDPSNPALSGLTPVPGAASEGSYSYSVDASTLPMDGNIIIESEGRANGVERQIRATIRRSGFLEFLYFTDYETLDPTAYPSAWQSWANNKCKKHEYSGRHSSCVDITWFGNALKQDVVEGPFHTNDTILVSGNPRWTEEATTSWTGDGTKHWKGSGSPEFVVGGDAAYRTPLNMPASNDKIKAQADPLINGQGCMYVGPTYIELEGDQMRVTSRATDEPNPPGTTVCETDGDPQPIPENGVVYVRNAASSEPNSSEEPPHPYEPRDSSFERRAGDVYVEGTLDGRLTIAAERNVILVGDVEYAGGRSASSDDMLGLVANNFVEIYHPVTAGGVNIPFRPDGEVWTDVHIDAALLSVAHSFRVQNHDKGALLGKIDLHGAMAQIFRGPVGSFNPDTNTAIHGYAKDYKYDDRLRYTSPPHYIDPVSAAWSVATWSIE
jgi:type II secretory pathway pseudopilin PulG